MLIPLLEIGDEGLRFMAAALAIGLGGFGPGLAIGNLVGRAMEALGRNPRLSP
jgi:F-type H+-transporting ATPase subunit c